jgi:Protein of unknown function (DUF4241)
LFVVIGVMPVCCGQYSGQRRQGAGPGNMTSSPTQAKSEEGNDSQIWTNHSKMPDASIFADVFGKSLSANYMGKRITFDVYNLGDLKLTTGKIIASDAFIPGPRPFQTIAPVGQYPVLIAIAKLGNDERIAFARIQFAKTPVVRWSMALSEGQNPSTVKPDQISCYPVDSGTGSFIEEAALGDVSDIMLDDKGISSAFSKEMDKVYRHTRTWAGINTKQGSAVIFSSGFGDGCYASYFGYDAKNRLTALLTNFEVIEWNP